MAATLAMAACSAADGDAGGTPAECEREPITSPGAEPVVDAATAALPAEIRVLGAQTLESIDRPGTLEVVVRLCSSRLDDAEAIAAATTVGRAVDASSIGEQVGYLAVGLWAPERGTVAPYHQFIAEDFAVFLWQSPNLMPEVAWAASGG